jgi:hypothetical protein
VELVVAVFLLALARRVVVVAEVALLPVVERGARGAEARLLAGLAAAGVSDTGLASSLSSGASFEGSLIRLSQNKTSKNGSVTLPQMGYKVLTALPDTFATKSNLL